MESDEIKISWASRFVGGFFVMLIRLYQCTAGRLLGGQCRFVPTCSNYAIEAIRIFGPVKGGIMTIWRILRCNPFSKGGVDFPGQQIRQ